MFRIAIEGPCCMLNLGKKRTKGASFAIALNVKSPTCPHTHLTCPQFDFDLCQSLVFSPTTHEQELE